ARAILESIDLNDPIGRALGLSVVDHAALIASHLVDGAKNHLHVVSHGWEAVVELGNLLLGLGGRSEDRKALKASIALLSAALTFASSEQEPLGWAATQANLGMALQTLGEREEGTTRLEEAAAAFRTALEGRTREREPVDWAMTQNNLGVVLLALAQR